MRLTPAQAVWLAVEAEITWKAVWVAWIGGVLYQTDGLERCLCRLYFYDRVCLVDLDKELTVSHGEINGHADGEK